MMNTNKIIGYIIKIDSVSKPRIGSTNKLIPKKNVKIGITTLLTRRMKIMSNSKADFLLLYNDLLPNRQGLLKEKL